MSLATTADRRPAAAGAQARRDRAIARLVERRELEDRRLARARAMARHPSAGGIAAAGLREVGLEASRPEPFRLEVVRTGG